MAIMVTISKLEALSRNPKPILLDSPGSPALKLMAYPVYPRYLLGAVQS